MELQQVNPTNHVLSLLRKGGKVILGAHSRKENEREKQVIQIAKQIRYPRYRSDRKENDIMLLQVQTYTSLMEYASPTLYQFLPSCGGDEPREFLVTFFPGVIQSGLLIQQTGESGMHWELWQSAIPAMHTIARSRKILELDQTISICGFSVKE